MKRKNASHRIRSPHTHRNRREPAEQNVALSRSRRRARQKSRGQTRGDHREKRTRSEDRAREKVGDRKPHKQSRERKNEKIIEKKKLFFFSFGRFSLQRPWTLDTRPRFLIAIFPPSPLSLSFSISLDCYCLFVVVR